jgi:WD40 repeat protein/predicted Ser/Thr protein kinase
MSSSSSDRDPVEQLADEFLARHRRGERPSLAEYTERYPQYADAIRRLFPALVKMEQLKPASDEPTGPSRPEAGRRDEPKLDRLGDYRLLREVGRGGMGIVYEAEQESLGRRVALKVLPGHARLDPRQLGRFEREAKAAARLHHSNIVPVYGVGEDNGLHYYVMQFIQGQGLDQVVAELQRFRCEKQAAPAGTVAAPGPAGDGASRGPASAAALALLTGQYFPDRAEVPAEGPSSASGGREPPGDSPNQGAHAPRSPLSGSSVHLPGSAEASASSSSGWPFWQGVARVGIQVAEALAYANNQGTLHRDIKPSNLLLDTQGTVWVTDFGLAKTTTDPDNLTHTGDIVGTVRYLAPERLQGRADARSDLYALGLTLYELLTLRPAFDATDRNQLMAQVTEAEPPGPRQVNPEIPRDLETVVLKALARDPAHRYQTAAELAEDLKRFVAGEPIRARRVSAWQRVVLWAKRRPAAAALVLVSGVAVLSLVAASTGALYNAWLQEALRDTAQAKEEAELAQQAEAQAKQKAQQAQQAESQARAKAEEALRAEAQARQQAERNKYLQHLALAAAELRNNSMVRVEQLLDACPREYQKNWEWRYLKQQCHRDLLTLRGHTGGIHGLAFSPDGTRLASSSLDGTLKVWDVTTGQVLHTLKGHSSEVASVAFSPDGKQLASAGFQDQMVKVWDASTGQELMTLRGHGGGLWDVAFSPDGRRLASASSDLTVKVWDATTGQEVFTLKGHSDEVKSVAFSPDGRRLASASQDRTVKVWDTANGQELLTLRRHTLGLNAVAFSPDGTRLASGGDDRTVMVWDATTGQEILTLQGHALMVYDLAFSPDGSQVASAGADQTVRVWDARTGQEVSTLQGHGNVVFSLAFSPDGTRLASGSQDRTVKFWDVTQSQKALTLRGHQAPVQAVAFSPDGTRLASASADQTAKIWDWATGQVLRTLEGHNGPVLSVGFSPDGTRLATASADQTGKVWEVSTGRLLHTLEGHTAPVVSVAFSPSGTQLATASHDQTARVWDASTGQALHTFRDHQNVVRSVAFNFDGSRLASGSGDLSVHIWNPTTGERVGTLKGAHCWVHSVTFSPKGSQLASDSVEAARAGQGRPRPVTRLALGSGDGTVQLWDILTGRPDHAIPAHGNFVLGVAFSPDGTRLASASADEVIKLWDVATGQEVLSLQGHTGGVNGVAFSPDGSRFASAGADGTVKIWDAQPVTAIERAAQGLLEFLFAKPLCRADVLDYLRTSAMIRPEVQKLALARAERHREETDPERFHQAGWALVRQPYLNGFQYRFALRQADAACRLAPEHNKYLTTRGLAQYRVGNYKEALATLTQADEKNKGVPADLAFLAMTQQQLGQKDQARATLERLRQTVSRPEWLKQDQAQAFWREAQAVATGPAGGAPQ